MYTELLDTYYKIKEERPLKWEVLQEKSVYEGYNVQKLPLFFAGTQMDSMVYKMKYRFQTDLINSNLGLPGIDSENL